MTRPGRAEVRDGAVQAAVLAVASLATFWLVTEALPLVYTVSRADDLLGGLWAVIAALFVCRASYQESMAAAASRTAATLVSFLICLVYLVFFASNVWAMAVLIGLSALAVILIGRPGDAVVAGVTTAVVMIVAMLEPHNPWQQPIRRFADTVVGVAIGMAAAWLGARVIRPRLARAR